VVIAACCLASPEQQQQRKKKPANGLLGLLRRQVAQTNKKNARANLPKARSKNGKKKSKKSEHVPTRRMKKRTTAMQAITTPVPNRGGVGGALAGGAVAGSLLGGAIAAASEKPQVMTTLAAADAATQTMTEAVVTSPAPDETSPPDVATIEALPTDVSEVAPQTEAPPAPTDPVA